MSDENTGDVGAATASAASATTTTSVPVVPTKPENMVPQSVVDRITAEKWNATRAAEENKRQLDLAQATIEELRKIATGDVGATATTTTTSATTTTPAKPDRISPDELRRLVNEQSAVERFNEACNKSVEEGRKSHSDFDQIVMRDLTKLSPIYDPRAGGPIIPQPLVEAALETGEAHEVLYALGKDPTTAERIMRLTPIKQAVEIAKFHDRLVAQRATTTTSDTDDTSHSPDTDSNDTDTAADQTEVNAPPNVSRAPAPMRASAGRGTGGARAPLDIMKPETMTTAQWVAAREKQLADKRRANGRAR